MQLCNTGIIYAVRSLNMKDTVLSLTCRVIVFIAAACLSVPVFMPNVRPNVFVENINQNDFLGSNSDVQRIFGLRILYWRLLAVRE